jgi:hypothetical protein
LHELGGSANSNWVSDIPFNLYYTLDKDNIVSMTDNSVIAFGNDKLAKIADSDLHVMNKFSLLDKIQRELI